VSWPLFLSRVVINVVDAQFKRIRRARRKKEALYIPCQEVAITLDYTRNALKRETSQWAGARRNAWWVRIFSMFTSVANTVMQRFRSFAVAQLDISLTFSLVPGFWIWHHVSEANTIPTFDFKSQLASLPFS
jgi:hypothetical protein